MQCGLQFWAQSFGLLRVHVSRVAASQPLAVGFRQAPSRIDQRRPCPYQAGSRSDHRQVRLRLCAAMLYRRQQRHGFMMAAVQTAMLGGLPYTVLRDAIFTHPTVAEGLVFLLANVPA